MIFDYTIVDDLNSEEIKSLLASNRIPRELREHIKQLLEVLEVLKLYPFVENKNKSIPKYTKAKLKLGEQEWK
jgi:hypothetical protein